MSLARSRSRGLLLLLLELAVVFLGVYLAIVFEDRQRRAERLDERAKVAALMIEGAGSLGSMFAGIRSYHESRNPEFLATLNAGEIPDFSGYRYVAPQYPMDLTQYAIGDRSAQLFDVEVYLLLSGFANQLQRIMYVEERLTEISAEYTPLPPQDHPQRVVVEARQRELAERFYIFLEDRRKIAAEISERAGSLEAVMRPLAGP